MTVLVDRSIPRTLAALVGTLGVGATDALVEAWVFEDSTARRAAESRLAALGVQATIRSAYKPLVCFFLEEVDRRALRKVTLRYPHHPTAPAGRFLAEAYPLAGLLDHAELAMVEGEEGLTYVVDLTLNDGSVAQHRVFAPNVVRDGVLSNCGWLRMAGGRDAAMPTEFESLFQAAVDSVEAQNWSGSSPAFERLTISIEMPGEDEEIGWGDEVISFREAMHEDIFFRLRENLTCDFPNDRIARRGQIVPDIRGTQGEARLRVTVSAFDAPSETTAETRPLAIADRPLGIAQVRAELVMLGGTPFSARSREGREVAGLYKAGSARPVLITAGQHANETSGVVGALRAAQVLMHDPRSHFALVPVENVDGYELHQRLIIDNPRHMHHAARFTACGDDISATVVEPDYERLARQEALVRSGAELHINLHGYPAHEWTRPLSGYLPQGFEDWSLPKGFFLIVVHHAGWADAASALLGHVTGRLAEDPALIAFNSRQIEVSRAHSAGARFEVMNGIACFLSQADTYETPLTIITESPDETIYGPAFLLQQTTQMRAVLACVEAYELLK